MIAGIAIGLCILLLLALVLIGYHLQPSTSLTVQGAPYEIVPVGHVVILGGLAWRTVRPVRLDADGRGRVPVREARALTRALARQKARRRAGLV